MSKTSIHQNWKFENEESNVTAMALFYQELLLWKIISSGLILSSTV
jgi:hypothetical protein